MTQQHTQQTKCLLPGDSGTHQIGIPRQSDIQALAEEYSTAKPDYTAGWNFSKVETESTERATLPVRGQR